MNQVERLISKLCPEGVEHRALWQVTYWDKRFNEVENFKQPKVSKYKYLLAAELKNLAADSGEIKLLTTNKSDLWTTREISPFEAAEGEIIAIPGGGNPIVQYYKGKFLTTDNRIAVSRNPEELNMKFLYFVLLERMNEISEFYRGSGIKHPSMAKVLDLRIPIPPIQVQDEIVRILNIFTKLEAELEAELEARKIQYEFYHRKLVGFGKTNEEVNWSTVQNICADKFWLMPATPKFEINGDIPYITSKNLKDGSIDFSSKKLISRDAYNQISKNRTIASGDILIGMIGTIGEVGHVQPKDLPFYGQNMYLLRLNPLVVDTKYFLQFMNSAEVRHHFASVKHNSSQGYLKAEHIENLRIPLPPLSEQKTIAKVLDTFKELTANLTYGLPAEIEARRQQYEYYRNKLLTFRKLEVV